MASAKPLLQDVEAPQAAEPSASSRARSILKTSLFVALAWWGFGVYAVLSTKSLAVLASLVDATIDLAAQGMLLAATVIANSGQKDSTYPLGLARLEPLGVVVCCVLMTLASGAVICESVRTLIIFLPDGPDMNFTNLATLMLSVVVVVKVVVWRLAKREYDRTNNVTLEALALDNFNDILSNFSALLFASVTRIDPLLWWMDPVGGILIGAYIIRSWVLTAWEQVDMLVGREANEDFMASVREMADKHHPDAEVDLVRAYHFGKRFLVEVELVMDKDTPLSKSHDVGLHLQHGIEQLEHCERCFVHIDYEKRIEDDHDPTVPIAQKTATPINRLRKGSLFQEFSNKSSPR